MRLSVSDLKQWLSCPQMFYYMSYLRRGAQRRQQALVIGDLFHKVMAAKLLGQDYMALAQQMELGLIDKEFDKWAVLKRQIVDFTVPSEWEILEVEQPMEFDIGGHVLLGTPDGAIRTMGDVWSLQWKTITHGADITAALETVRTGFHEAVYHRYIAQRYGSCAGSLVGHAVKPRSNSKNGVSDWQIECVPVARTLHSVDRRLTDIRRTFDEIQTSLDRWTSSQLQNTDSCYDRWGHRCQFWQVCHEGVDIRDNTQFVDIPLRYQEASAES